MNVLLLDQFSDLGGAQRCLLDLLPAMRLRGWRTVVAAPGEGDLFRRAQAEGAIVRHVSCGPYSHGAKAPGDILRFARQQPRLKHQLVDLIEEYRIDLLYVNGPRMAPAAVWAAGRSVPLVFHCHSYVPEPYATWLVARPLARVGATVTSSSRFAATSIGLETSVIYNGVADCARPKVPACEGFRIGVVGRIAPQKGQAIFLQSARILLQSAPDCRFEISGAALFADPEAKEYYSQVEQLGRGLPVEFSGWTDDIGSVLARVDVLVVPSVNAEATTRVILEAFSAEVPVVAFATGGIPEVIAHERTGVLVAEPSPEALASALAGLVWRGRDKLSVLARAARGEWRTRFTLERYQNDVLALLESAQEGAKKQRRHNRQDGGRGDHYRITEA
jgi:glycosyltransferase involved in cell wall biosynthesis